MQTQAHEINEVVGLPLDHSFGADYLQRFPIASDLPRPRDVFDWLSRTGYWQWVDTEEVKALLGFVNDRLTLHAVHAVIDGFKRVEAYAEGTEYPRLYHGTLRAVLYVRIIGRHTLYAKIEPRWTETPKFVPVSQVRLVK